MNRVGTGHLAMVLPAALASGEIVSEKHESARDEAAEKAADARQTKKK
jgi:hypothetical protein